MTNGHRGTDRPRSFSGSETENLVSRKAALRAEAARRRDRAAAETGPDAAARAIRDRVLETISLPPASAASAFWPMGSELDLRPLMQALCDAGHRVGLPVVVGRGKALVFRAWRPGLALVPGGFGTQVPGPDQPEIRPDVLLVPLLAFDRAGYRLGYGGGFYDRTLSALRADGPVCAVGVGYAAQEVPEVPRAGYDQCLDWIVTEREAIRVA